MFATTELNVLTQILSEQDCSGAVFEKLKQRFVNFEATLLRAKVLREFSKQHQISMIQSAIPQDHMSLAYFFSPFILANLNQCVIYSTPLNEQVLHILQPYYHVEKTLNLNGNAENILESLKLNLDFQDAKLTDKDLIYLQFLNALTQSNVSTIILITDLKMNLDALKHIETFFKVKVLQIQPKIQLSILNQKFTDSAVSQQLDLLNMQKLLFKRKDDFHVNLCRQFAELNAEVLTLLRLYEIEQATNLVEDMFYSEHIFEKLSVYSEYMQTQLQNLGEYHPDKIMKKVF